jgi:hypothetical protein
MEKIKFVGKCLVVEEAGEKILVIGDLHLGYEESLNSRGVFVSRTMFAEGVTYLESVFRDVGSVNFVVLLGDIKHEFGKITNQERADVLRLLDFLSGKCKEIILIRGNHDKTLQFIVKNKEIEVRDYFVFGKYCFLHGDKDFEEIYDKKIKFWIVGHAHPAVRITDGIKQEKYRCFLVGKYKWKNVIILPSFFGYSLGSDPRENKLGLVWALDFEKFNVEVVSERDLEVLDFGILKKLDNLG